MADRRSHCPPKLTGNTSPFPCLCNKTQPKGIPDGLPGRRECLVCQHPTQPRHGVPGHGRGFQEAREDPAHGACCGILRALRADPRKGERQQNTNQAVEKSVVRSRWQHAQCFTRCSPHLSRISPLRGRWICCGDEIRLCAACLHCSEGKRHVCTQPTKRHVRTPILTCPFPFVLD